LGETEAGEVTGEHGVLVVDEKNWPGTLGMKSVPLDHPLYGRSVRSANCLRNAGLTDKEKIRSKIQSGELRPYLSIRHYGKRPTSRSVGGLGCHKWIACQGSRFVPIAAGGFEFFRYSLAPHYPMLAFYRTLRTTASNGR
jgi:hypothetical protein